MLQVCRFIGVQSASEMAQLLRTRDNKFNLGDVEDAVQGGLKLLVIVSTWPLV